MGPVTRHQHHNSCGHDVSPHSNVLPEAKMIRAEPPACGNRPYRGGNHRMRWQTPFQDWFARPVRHSTLLFDLHRRDRIEPGGTIMSTTVEQRIPPLVAG